MPYATLLFGKREDRRLACSCWPHSGCLLPWLLASSAPRALSAAVGPWLASWLQGQLERNDSADARDQTQPVSRSGGPMPGSSREAVTASARTPPPTACRTAATAPWAGRPAARRAEREAGDLAVVAVVRLEVADPQPVVRFYGVGACQAFPGRPGSRAGYAARSAAVIWRTTREPWRIWRSTSLRPFWRRSARFSRWVFISGCPPFARRRSKTAG